MERMLEAARQGYWQTDAATIDELKQRYRDLAKRYDVRSDNTKFSRYVGYGLAAPSASAAAAKAKSSAPTDAAPQPPAPTPPPIRGLQLEKVASSEPPARDPATAAALTLLMLTVLGGAWRQTRQGLPERRRT